MKTGKLLPKKTKLAFRILLFTTWLSAGICAGFAGTNLTWTPAIVLAGLYFGCACVLDEVIPRAPWNWTKDL